MSTTSDGKTLKTTITPVLTASAGYVSDIREQVASLVRFTIMNPGFISSHNEKRLLSFRRLAAEFGHNRDQLALSLEMKMKATLSTMFPDYSSSCLFTTSDYDKDSPDGRYTIKFDIHIKKLGTTDTGMEPALVQGMITVDSTNNNAINVRFQNLNSLI